MHENPVPELPYSPAPALPASSVLPENPHDSLMLQASVRWRESAQGLSELVAASPGMRDTINQVLRAQWAVDGEKTGLAGTAIDGRAARFVTLADACAFVVQQPLLEATIDQHWRVSGLPAGHKLATLTPRQLLERLKALDVEDAHLARWQRFWNARATGTALSHRERAVQLYRDHFEAASHVAMANNSLTAEQVNTLQLIIDPPAGTLKLGDQVIHTEKLALVLKDHSKVKLIGAWVIYLGAAASARPMLYLPCRPVGIQAFAQKSAMEAWLTAQALVPAGMPSGFLGFEYTGASDPMITGASDLFADRQQAQILALRNGSNGKPGLKEHGALALAKADLIDRQRSNTAIVASPPVLAPLDIDEDEPLLFGSLSAAVPWSVRQTALKRQRDLLETLLANDPDGTRLQNCKDAIKDQESAEQACESAVTALLDTTHAIDYATYNTQLTAIGDAHRKGLLAEARLQNELGQLDNEEHAQLKAALNSPNEDAIAAELTLSFTESTDGTTKVHTETLRGPFVIASASARLDPGASDALLLYWPGTDGGLQRFTDRRQLEQSVFKIQDNDPQLKMALTRVDSDIVLRSLTWRIRDFLARADALRKQPERAGELATLRLHTHAALQIPVNAARTLAFAHVQEQDRSVELASRLPGWLSNLSAIDRSTLKELIQSFIRALHRSHEQLTLALEPRDDFTRKHLHQRLRDDFSIKGDFSVTLNLPDVVKIDKRYKPAPGHSGYELIQVPGDARSDMSLEELAQLNVDNTPSMQLEPLSLRLNFMQVKVTSADAAERKTLEDGINRPYLMRILPALDLPAAYEQRIRDTYIGAANESVYVREHRRECLIEPWRRLLRLQGEFARLQQHINADESAILKIAVDANTAEAWHANGKRVVIHAAYLSTGGKDTDKEGPATLSGVTFIEEQISHTTLLYLPDSPDERFLRRYDNLEGARMGLYRLSQQDQWASYLAGRALHGEVRAHEIRLAEAAKKGFDAIIGIGERWPATTSLAAHQLDAQMGRLIEAHRGTSRSNDALYMERYALKGPRLFNYIKMGLSVLPFIGSAIALYDAWTSANQAVAAFLRAEVGEGLAQIESVLLSLVDAAMDLLPGELALSGIQRSVRSLARARQLRVLLRKTIALHKVSPRQARHLITRFAGYEYEQPISLAGLHPGTHGIYRGIYQHADGDFIERQGRIYAVERSTDSRNWRLRGTRRATYKQPVALDESGRWDTWFGVHGSTFEGGGLGGGNIVGHLADAVDPFWPPAIRQRLPRWWADPLLRRHLHLTRVANELAGQIEARGAASDIAINRYASAYKASGASLQTNPEANLQALMADAEAACIGDIPLVIRRYEALTELLPLTHGNKRRSLIVKQSKAAWLLADRYWRRAFHASHTVIPITKRIDDLSRKLNNLPQNALARRVEMLEEIRRLRIDYVHRLDQIEVLRNTLDLWYNRISIQADKSKMTKLVEEITTKHSDGNLLYLRTSQRLEIVQRYSGNDDVSWYYLLSQARDLRHEIDRTLYMQYTLADIDATAIQRSHILENCFNLCTRFRLEMKRWTSTYPQHFHMDEVPVLMSGIERLAERAQRGIINAPVPGPVAAGQPARRLFTTADNQLLYGVERWEPTTQRHQYVMTGRGGYEEIWEQGADNRFSLTNPRNTDTLASSQLKPADLLADAQRRLDAQPDYLTRIQGYADQDMLPVDLQHMMDSEATELTTRADLIATVNADHAIIARLRNKAAELRVTGRALRTRQSLTSQKPTDGMLDDLIQQAAVDIRRAQPIKHLGIRNGRHDYLQEYEIWNVTLEPDELLWYAHFHYRNAQPALRSFEKAHLKLPQHRFVTHAQNADLPYADIGRQSTVLAHFEDVL
ncbi:SicP binding protein [Pseudomonas sp. IT-347P]|uniref:dermonecrotic toxin domain-containing protein n=1 Tax=Pseudomonas sp. IT-347P TaxID=3026458 RepID=UPI0039DFEE5E